MRKRLRIAIAIVAAVALGVVTNASPAYAEGAGVSVGESDITAHGDIEIGEVPCIDAVGNPSITLLNVGTVGVLGDGMPQSESPAAEYAGPSEAEFRLEHFAFGPQGTFEDDDDDCTGVPQPIDVTSWTLHDVAFVGVEGVGTVDCAGAGPGPSGTYLRVTNVYTITVSGECDVTTSVDGQLLSVQNAPVTFVFTGSQNPCLPSPPLPASNCDVPNTEFQGTYVQTPDGVL